LQQRTLAELPEQWKEAEACKMQDIVTKEKSCAVKLTKRMFRIGA